MACSDMYMQSAHGSAEASLMLAPALKCTKRACRDLTYVFTNAASPDIISPKGMHQSARMRKMRHLFDGPVPTALDASMAALPQARPATAPSRQQLTPPAQAQLGPLSKVVDAPALSADLEVAIDEGWQEETNVTYRRRMHGLRSTAAAAGRLQQRPAMVAIPESDSMCASISPQGGGARRLSGARPGVPRSPSGYTGRHYAGVQQLANMFETTRLSQVGPVQVSKVQSLVSRYEGPRGYRRGARAGDRP